MKLLIHSQTSTAQPFGNGCNYLSMLWLNLINVSKMCPWHLVSLEKSSKLTGRLGVSKYDTGSLSLTGICSVNPLWAELICGLPLQMACNVELGRFLYCLMKQSVEQTVKLPVIWETVTLMWYHCDIITATPSPHSKIGKKMVYEHISATSINFWYIYWRINR